MKLKFSGLKKQTVPEQELAKAVLRRCDKYVPLDTGALKGSGQVQGNRIIYKMPYARAQYYLPYAHKDPRRGRFWEKRMLAAERKALEKEIKGIIRRDES